MNNLYGNPYQMIPQQNPYLPQRANYPNGNSIIWVQGIEGAKAYQLAPNSNVQLMDSENEGRFYIKVSDNVGMCTLRIFDYVEVTNTASTTPQMPDMTEYVKRSELSEIVDAIKELRNEQSVSATKQQSTNGKSFFE